MMHNQNLAFTEFDNALSPLREAAAYEALLAEPQATVKTIAGKITKRTLSSSPPRLF